MVEQNTFGNVCAVVVTYNIGNVFDTCFNSLKGQVDHIVIVNTSTDEGVTRHVIDRLQAENPDLVTLIESPENNLSLARNLGIDAALASGHDWVLLMDHDSRLGAGMIAALEQAYLHHLARQTIGILAPTPTDAASQPGAELLSVPASGSLIPRRVLTELKFDPALVIDYADTDFCLRLRRKKFHILAVPGARMTQGVGRYTQHRVWGFSVTTTNRPAQRRYYQFRNRLILWRRYCGIFPAFFLNDFACAIREFMLIHMFEEDRIAKTKCILSGLIDGALGRTGPQKGTSLTRHIAG